MRRAICSSRKGLHRVAGILRTFKTARMAEETKQCLFINGFWVKPASMFPTINPATEEVLAMAPAASAEQVDEAVRAAAAAFEGPWGATTGKERAKYLRAIAAKVKERKPRLARLDALDNGKPLPEALWDMDDVAGCFEFYAGLADELDAQQEQRVDVGDDGFHAALRYEPAGVVGAIVPWNYPMLMATWKVAPALAAGCTVVLKPSELTPLTALELASVCEAVGLPAGVLNVVPGFGDPVGAALAAHPRVDKLTFTGSVPTGSRIMRSAADNVTNVTLELGGKSPAIVFDDANLERTVEWVMFGCFWTNGQICSSTSRLLLHDSVADRFLDLLQRETAKIVIGDPLADGVKMGPLVSAAQQAKVLGFVERARAAGATVLCGGGRPAQPAKGFYVEPTVLIDVTPDMEVWREEIFGPVLSVMRFSTEDEAIRLANDSQFGLAAAVFSANGDQLTRAARRLRSGIVWQNCSQPAFCQLPWGGFKRSGIGRDLGRPGFQAYLEPKQLVKYNKEEDLGWYRSAKL